MSEGFSAFDVWEAWLPLPKEDGLRGETTPELVDTVRGELIPTFVDTLRGELTQILVDPPRGEFILTVAFEPWFRVEVDEEDSVDQPSIEVEGDMFEESLGFGIEFKYAVRREFSGSALLFDETLKGLFRVEPETRATFLESVLLLEDFKGDLLVESEEVLPVVLNEEQEAVGFIFVAEEEEPEGDFEIGASLEVTLERSKPGFLETAVFCLLTATVILSRR